MPEELSGIVEAVLGLDDRPQESRTFRRHAPRDAGGVAAWRRRIQRVTAFTPLELARPPPESFDGIGECIAIIELAADHPINRIDELLPWVVAPQLRPAWQEELAKAA